MEKIETRQQAYRGPVRFKPKGPRYLRGPTVIGLKVVVQVLQQTTEPIHGRDIYDYIHNNGLGNEVRIPARPPPSIMGMNGRSIPQPPEPSHPEHPVRSYKYMKGVLLNALESHGRIRKIHTITPLDPANPPDPDRTHIKDGMVHEWKWELIPPKDNMIAWEEQESFDMIKADRTWLENMKRQGNQDSVKSIAINIAGPRANDPNFTRIPKKRLNAVDLFQSQDPAPGDPTERTRSILGLTGRKEDADTEYGNHLATRWREVTTRRNEVHKEASGESKMYWKDPEHMQQRERHRAMFNVKPFMSNYNPELFKDGARPGFNKDEPEYRQSRQGKNDIPIALRDPRARQFGFNYGLPKQKRLLEAANARGSQPEWTYQPPQDFSHLSKRRQRTREEQTREMATEFNTVDKHDRRKAAEATKRPAAQPVTSDESPA